MKKFLGGGSRCCWLAMAATIAVALLGPVQAQEQPPPPEIVYPVGLPYYTPPNKANIRLTLSPLLDQALDPRLIPGSVRPTLLCTLFQDQFYRAVDIFKYAYNTAFVGAHHEVEAPGEGSWSLPTFNNRTQAIAIIYDVPHPECDDGTLRQDVIARGQVWINGVRQSALKVSISAAQGSDTKIIVGVGLLPKASTVELRLPVVRLFRPTSSSVVILPLPILSQAPRSRLDHISFYPDSVFDVLRLTYESNRCQACHRLGDSESISDFHTLNTRSSVNGTPDDGSGCENCHDMPINRMLQRFPDLDNNFGSGWQSPSFSKDIDWHAQTVLQRCQKTVDHLSQKLTPQSEGPPVNLGLAANIYNHFMRDPRLVWAVNDGAPHQNFGDYHCQTGPAGTCAWPNDRYNPNMQLPTAFPHDYDDMGAMIQDWIDQGGSCTLGVRSGNSGYYRVRDTLKLADPAEYPLFP